MYRRNRDRTSTGDRAHRKPIWLAVVISIAAVLGLIGLLARQHSAVSAIVIPVALDELEPQVTAHVKKFMAAADDRPTDADRRAELGMVLAANGLWREAHETFAQAVHLDSQQRLAHYYMGIAKQELGEPLAALAVFQEIAKEFPDFGPGHNSLGESLLVAGKLKDAKLAFQRTISLAPDKPDGYVGLADTLLHERDYKGAERAIQQAINLRPGHRRARYLRGLTYRGLGRREAAERELRSGMGFRKEAMLDTWTERIRHHDKSAQGQISLAVSYAGQGDVLKAKQILETALEWSPQHINLLNNLATVHLSLEEPHKALEYAKRAEQLDKNRAEILITSALCHESLGKLHHAIEHIDAAIGLAPGLSRAYYIKAKLLRKTTDSGRQRKLGQILENLRTAQRLDPSRAILHTECGIVLMRQRHFDAAKQEFQRAIALDDGDVTAHLNLATVCLQLKQWREARDVIVAATKRAPDDARVKQLMETMRRLGDH